MALTTKRLNWLKWLYPGEGGLQSEQDWLIDKRRNHMKDEHSSGVVLGLKVLATSPTPDLDVHVQVGRAIGGDGEEIVLESIVDVDLSSYASGGASVKVVAEYAEQGTDPYIVPETTMSQDKFTQDNPTITTIIGAPAANQIVLAEVVVSNGATQITDAADPISPGTNEIDHTTRVNVLKARLKTLDPNNGNLEDQFANMVPGDQFIAMPGVYTAGIDLTLNVNNIRIFGTEGAIFDLGSTMIQISADNVHLDNVTLKSTTAGSSPLLELNGANNCRIRDVFITADDLANGRVSGIEITGTSVGNIIEGCRIIDCWDDTHVGAVYGVYIDGSGVVSTTIKDCIIGLTTFPTATFTTQFIAGSASDGEGTRIVGCEFERMEWNAGPAVFSCCVLIGDQWTVSECKFKWNANTADSSFIYAENNVRGCVIADNVCRTPSVGSLVGRFLFSDNQLIDTSITGNVIPFNGGGSSEAMCIEIQSGTNITITGNKMSCINSNTTGFCIKISATDVTITGNDFVIGANGAVASYGVWVVGGFGAGENITITGNDFEETSNDVASTSVGIFIDKSGDTVHISVVGNTMKSGLGTALPTAILVDASYVSVVGNSISSLFTVSIDFTGAGSTYCTAVGNTIVTAVQNHTGVGTKVAHNTNDATHDV